MSWPTDDLDTTHLDAGADNAARARPALLRFIERLKHLINARGAGGVCELGADGKVPPERIGRNQAGGVAGLTAAGKLLVAQLPFIRTHEWSETSLRRRLSDGAWSAYVDMRGPQGPRGPRGPRGPAGPQGPQGPPASTSGGGGNGPADMGGGSSGGGGDGSGGGGGM